MLTIILFIYLLFPFLTVEGQDRDFVPGDDNYSLLLAFHRTDTITVVTPAGFDLTEYDRELIEAFPFWGDFQKIPCYHYLKETDLVPADLAGRIQYYGPFGLFRDASVPGMPFRPCNKGFIFGDSICNYHDDPRFHSTGYGLYNEPGDAFFWLSDDSTRLFTCSNAGHGFIQYRTYMAGYYQLYIFRGDDLHVTGFSPASEPAQSGIKPGLSRVRNRINYLPGLRKNYFKPYRGRYFDFEIASDFDIDSLGRIIEMEADRFTDTLLHRLGVTMKQDKDRLYVISPGNNSEVIPWNRILTYIYTDRIVLQRFIAAPSWTTVHGKASGSVNHLSLFDPPLFRHEAAHSIIEQIVGLNPNSFFSEGFAVSMEYFFTPESLDNDREAVRANADQLTRDLLYSSTGRFYSIPGAYQISGVFTRYLTDILGIRDFIRAYSTNTIEACLMEKTGLDIEQAISRFIESLVEKPD